MNKNDFDIIVIGSGHAGIEACLASARMGLNTAVVTINLDNIGQMSCNPAIGGLAKGHLVREIDSLGGEMGRAIDKTGIQFRTLNTKKGPAVRSSRAQADMFLYKQYMKIVLENTENLTLIQSMADSLIVENNEVKGVELWTGDKLFSDAVILTTGTFLRGLVHIGLFNYKAGRAGDFASNKLSLSLSRNNLELGRLKTGTTPRLDGRTISFSELEEQRGDDGFTPFSLSNKKIENKISCFITYTNEKTHDIIKGNLDKSPLYCGVIKGTGPRYCPSIEDKVVRFKDKERHQIFLEKESLNSNEYYPNGLSTSLPLETQLNFLRTIEGLQNVKILRPGYAIEYDYVLPTELYHSLETRKIGNLFLAGQINGTSGYEEAAAQGIMAGINASLKLKDEEPLILGRDEAYIGVMIDDLITLGTTEPYRMFTSRAEYRLLLREDNADFRLCEYGRKIGLLDDERYNIYRQRLTGFNEVLNFIKISEGGRLYNILKRPEVDILQLKNFSGEDGLCDHDNVSGSKKPFINIRDYGDEILKRVELYIKYEGYINRQKEEIKKMKKFENYRLDKNMDYKSLSGLSIEVIEKLNKIKPETIYDASRISGITPAAISILLMHCSKTLYS
ncbi:MAG: tRNA uridine-5-carboxymethylaminomethyl(34) synthesis enzyme MnmG [Candidatus Acididesulfobacter guangdongensis]|uniref:tRNA uridine 5-carboxymethylaminomethyl modification enzyme MnmG n=1 Tax=Acididesulfobacter guangdongensis TaxID=2597225 RepID=A0A519BIV0_ACIG2|nr:MAG: tRNA uridine-5-carboxymethylaminomethyl(34) synthesis enzyme MnmG [Candidatus Acididesulfobacter guangdongensis]